MDLASKHFLNSVCHASVVDSYFNNIVPVIYTFSWIQCETMKENGPTRLFYVTVTWYYKRYYTYFAEDRTNNCGLSGKASAIFPCPGRTSVSKHVVFLLARGGSYQGSSTAVQAR